MDRTTRLPLRYTRTVAGVAETETYFTYDADRRATSSLASDFFSPVPAAGSEISEEELPAATPPDGSSPSTPAVTLAQATALRQALGLTSTQSFVEATLANATLRLDDIGIPLTDSERTEMRTREQLSKDTSTITGAFPSNSDYGGLWMDQAAGGRVKVALKPGANRPSLETAVRAAFTIPQRIDFVDALYSATQLDAKLSEVVAADADLRGQGTVINLAFIDPVANRVRIELETSDTAAQQAVRDRFGAMVEVVQGAAIEQQSRQVFPVRSPETPTGLQLIGTRTTSQRGPQDCSTGFSMRGTGSRRNEWSILTAGHCNNGRNERWVRATSGVNGINVGRTLRVNNGSVLSEGDISAIDAMQVKVRPSRASSRIVVSPGASDGTGARYYRVLRQLSRAEQPVNKLVCVAGQTDPRQRCGQLVSNGGYSRNPDSGLLYRGFNLVRQPTDGTPRTQSGDSGAGVYRYSSALGVLQGGNARYFSYTPISVISTAFQARVATPSGEPTP